MSVEPSPVAGVRELRPFWLCADDYGMAAGVNKAIRDLATKGHLNAVSVMTVAPRFDEAPALAEIVQGGRPAIGLHFTLTAPYRPLTPGAPTQAGRFLPLAALMRAAFLRRLDGAALRAEVDAQLAAFAAAFGRAPDFVDGHQHVHLLPQIRDAVLAGVKAAAPKAWLRQCGGTHRAISLVQPKTLTLTLLSAGFARRARAAGIATNPAFAGAYEFRAGSDFAALFPRFLDGLPAGGVVMCHPGVVDDALRKLDPLTTLREREYAYLREPTFLRVLASHGLRLA